MALRNEIVKISSCKQKANDDRRKYCSEYSHKSFMSLYDDLVDLPRRARIIYLILQRLVRIIGVDDEGRSLVTDRHVFPIPFQGQQGSMFGKIRDRNFGCVIVQRHGKD